MSLSECTSSIKSLVASSKGQAEYLAEVVCAVCSRAASSSRVGERKEFIALLPIARKADNTVRACVCRFAFWVCKCCVRAFARVCKCASCVVQVLYSCVCTCMQVCLLCCASAVFVRVHVHVSVSPVLCKCIVRAFLLYCSCVVQVLCSCVCTCIYVHCAWLRACVRASCVVQVLCAWVHMHLCLLSVYCVCTLCVRLCAHVFLLRVRL